MALGSGTRLANLCRVCIQDVTYVPSDSIFESTDQGSLSIHGELVVICPQVFSEESAETKPLADDAPGLPSKVCINCKFKIDEAYGLHQMCLESNRKLWEMLAAPAEVTIKCEFEDVIQVEPTQLVLPEEFAGYLDDLSEKSPPKAAEPKITKSKVKRTILKTPKAEPAEKSNSNPERKVKKKLGRPRKYPQGYQLRDKPEDQVKYRCEKCGLGTKAENKLHTHIKISHPDEAVKCDQCPAAFFNEAALEEHKLVHTLPKPYGCPDCKRMFATRRNVVLHKPRCSGSTPYMCSECGKAFSYRASLRHHVLTHKEKTFACDRCPSKFYVNGALQAHLRTHNKINKVPCEICGTLVSTKNVLQKHMKSKHSNRERPHACDLCSLRFYTSNKLKRHMLIHTGEKPYKCTECDRAFAQSNDLVKHSRTHFGDKPYKCDRCDETFRLLSELKNHYEVHFKAGDNQNADHPDTIEFTVLGTLKRRAEQERKQNHQNSDQSSDELDN